MIISFTGTVWQCSFTEINISPFGLKKSKMHLQDWEVQHLGPFSDFKNLSSSDFDQPISQH